MPESEKNTMIIAEQDDDLSKSLSLFFANNYNVIIKRKFKDVQTHIDIAKILLIEANILEKTGLNILQNIKNNYPDVKIVVMGTSWTTNKSKEEFVKNNADALVYKPFDINSISLIITKLLSNDLISQSTL